LQTLLDAAAPRSVVRLDPGEYAGPAVIDKPVTVEGVGASIWAERGPVLTITSPDVRVHGLAVEATGKASTGSARVALRLDVRTRVVVAGLRVRGEVVGLPGEEGSWALPGVLDLGALEPKRSHEARFEVTVPVACSLRSEVAGLRVSPERLDPGAHEVAVTIDGLMPGTYLDGEILVVTGACERAIHVSGYARAAEASDSARNGAEGARHAHAVESEHVAEVVETHQGTGVVDPEPEHDHGPDAGESVSRRRKKKTTASETPVPSPQTQQAAVSDANASAPAPARSRKSPKRPSKKSAPPPVSAEAAADRQLVIGGAAVPPAAGLTAAWHAYPHEVLDALREGTLLRWLREAAGEDGLAQDLERLMELYGDADNHLRLAVSARIDPSRPVEFEGTEVQPATQTWLWQLALEAVAGDRPAAAARLRSVYLHDPLTTLSDASGAVEWMQIAHRWQEEAQAVREFLALPAAVTGATPAGGAEPDDREMALALLQVVDRSQVQRIASSVGLAGGDVTPKDVVAVWRAAAATNEDASAAVASGGDALPPVSFRERLRSSITRLWRSALGAVGAGVARLTSSLRQRAARELTREKLAHHGRKAASVAAGRLADATDALRRASGNLAEGAANRSRTVTVGGTELPATGVVNARVVANVDAGFVPVVAGSVGGAATGPGPEAWYRWVAPSDAAVTFEVAGSGAPIGLKVFEVESFGRARRLDPADGSAVAPGCVFPTKTGSTYVLGLRSGDATQGTYALRWRRAEGSPVTAGGEPRATERPGVRIAASRDHSLIVLGNGRVMGWGSSDSGAHGLDDALAEPRTVRGLEDVVEVAAGDGFVGGGLPARSFSLALGLDGQIRAWGSNQYGFLGVGLAFGAAERSHVPTLVTGIPERIVSVVAGSGHALALGLSGRVWAWGHNAAGQLGRPPGAPAFEPVQVPDFGRVTAIAATIDASFAMLDDGTLWGWGRSDLLGVGLERGVTATPQSLVPSNDFGTAGDRLVAIFAGGNTVFVKDDRGRVFGWGDTRDGQLGPRHADVVGRPVELPALAGAVQVAVGWHHAIALMPSGGVMAWGSHRLATGTASTLIGMPNPVPVPGLEGIVGVGVGREHSLAVRFDDAVMGWGKNAAQVVGDGGHQDRDVPVRVIAGRP
jgi:alpha-tubulin suppressor-like RCC1 family protein